MSPKNAKNLPAALRHPAGTEKRERIMHKKTAILLLFLLLSLCCGCAAQEQSHVIWSAGAAKDDPAAVEETDPTQPTEAALHDDGLEYAIFPMEYLNITQTSGEGTHACNWALDFAGQDTGIDEFFAPFTLRVVRIQTGYNIVWAQSVDKVHLANGGLDYVTMLLEHSDKLGELYVGQVIPQGQVFYWEGTAGNAIGNHVHCEFALGKYVDEGSHHAEDGRVAINNGNPANEILFLTQSTVHSPNGDGGFAWQTLDATTAEIAANGWHCQGQGHQAGAVTTTPPTCTTDGSLQYTCALCARTVTERIPATGHDPVETRRVPPADGACGAVFYTCNTCGEAWIELLWETAPACGFSDVVADDPAAASIADVCARGLMTGFTDTEFLPDGYLSRVELLEILYDLSGDTGWYRCDYSDVDEDDEAYNLIGWATAHRLASATAKDKFAPEAAVTREDAITMVLGYLALRGQRVPAADPSSVEAWVISTGMFARTEDLHCAMTRAEAARLLALMLHLPEIDA